MKRRGTRTCVGVILVLLLFSMGCSSSQDPVTDPVPAGATGTWYAGDLHCHSTHSDGDSPVAEVIAAAERQGLDFFVITDHDGNMRGVPTHWHDPDYRSHEVMMGDNVVLHEPRRVDFEVRVLQPGSVPASLATIREETRRLSLSAGGPEPGTLEERISSLGEDEEYLIVILKNGSVHGEWPLNGDPGLLTFSDIVEADTRVYYRVELLGKPPADPINSLLRGRMRALSNPIYFGFPE